MAARSSSGLPPTPTLDRKGSWRPPHSEVSSGSVASASGADPLLSRSQSASQRGGGGNGIQLEKTRRATVLNDKYILGEELGRGAYGQARGTRAAQPLPCAQASVRQEPTRRPRGRLAARAAAPRHRRSARTPPAAPRRATRRAPPYAPLGAALPPRQP